jgi:hypothetical protein
MAFEELAHRRHLPKILRGNRRHLEPALPFSDDQSLLEAVR